MDRQQLIIATAAGLLAAFVIGWLACWLVQRLTRPGAADLGHVAGELALRLHEAEAARDTGAANLARREADLTARLATAEEALNKAHAALHENRTEIEELRDYIEKRLARARGATS